MEQWRNQKQLYRLPFSHLRLAFATKEISSKGIGIKLRHRLNKELVKEILSMNLDVTLQISLLLAVKQLFSNSFSNYLRIHLFIHIHYYIHLLCLSGQISLNSALQR